jgi:hypothetical protein
MFQAFVFEKIGVVLGDLYFLDPEPAKGQEGPEHGVRLELRVFGHGEPNGSIYAAVPITAGRPIWRVDLLESVDGTIGSNDRAHHHPSFSKRTWDPRPREFRRDLMADPLGWLGEQLADLPAVLERAGVEPEIAAPSDAGSLRELAPVIVSTARFMLDKVRAGELGTPPADDAADSIRNGWL